MKAKGGENNYIDKLGFFFFIVLQKVETKAGEKRSLALARNTILGVVFRR